jgi:predicted ATP-dependent Lon-type protease
MDFGKMTGRNQDALKKTTAGLLKLVFPHRTADDLEPDELEMCLSLATECRQRVLDQLAVMLPEEFGGVRVEMKNHPYLVQDLR